MIANIQGFKPIAVKESTKAAFDALHLRVAIALPDTRVTHDYMIREMCAALTDKLDRQENERCNSEVSK